MRTRHPDLTLVYLPHLDYDLQRFGPDGPALVPRPPRDLDAVAGPAARRRPAQEGRTVVALSEYGITRVRRPVDINRALRRAGLLEVHTQDGMEYLDPWPSRAFAVADHQLAHVYVRDPADWCHGRATSLAELPGVERGPRRRGQDEPRPRPPALRRARRRRRSPTPGSPTTTGSTTPGRPTSPSSSRSTASPATTRPSSSWTRTTRYVKAQGGGRARPQEARLPLPHGCRAARPIAGARHPRPAAGRPDDGPVLLCSEGSLARDRLEATDVKPFLLELAGLGGTT